ncbi:hypothetical protein GALMADRAFT_267857 [Galerina marginata CBS 339.88]|uniref:Uncharacterized protein n=1 Tax=Galerina marginata (strain CBS 339.88) TaxID=685588 RepID=A0A067T8G5_GALM3|nr:hypothetical protein GALMADRAFT_267857 [Galerina marginata CBS 339.88]
MNTLLSTELNRKPDITFMLTFSAGTESLWSIKGRQSSTFFPQQCRPLVTNVYSPQRADHQRTLSHLLRPPYLTLCNSPSSLSSQPLRLPRLPCASPSKSAPSTLRSYTPAHLLWTALFSHQNGVTSAMTSAMQTTTAVQAGGCS